MTNYDRPMERPFQHRPFVSQAAVATLALCSLFGAGADGQQTSVAHFEQTFANPPQDTRPMMRWWWFGPAVVDSELSRELHVMQVAGIGGVEIQPVYPLALDDPATGIKNLPYLSPEFLSAVHFSDATARSLGLRVDITLGSGWPYGGPGTTLALSAGRLKLVEIPVQSNSTSLPQAATGDTLLAAFTASGEARHWDPATARQLTLTPRATSVTTTTEGPATLLLFYASHTRQQVKRPAVGAEGFVIDHFARPAIEEHLHDVADKLAAAFGAQPPYSVFSDSLEVYGSDWTLDLPAQFQQRRGYDIIPHLPELWAGGSAQADAVRNDWGRTLSDLIRDNYLQPINNWAKSHNTLFRSQTYGEPAVTLADEAVPSLPEGEGPQWRQFSFTRWASSASHLYDRPVTSAETFTWLHSPVFSATPLDMKVEADRMFLSGVNQIIGHGWPYTPPGVPEPGWNLYAAAVFDDHNPWFPVMPDIAKYLQRASWLLRQGEPANDVAVFLPEDDAQAAFTPGHVSVTDEMKKRISNELMRTILDAGYNLDYIDAATIDKVGLHYPILILPPTTRIPFSTARALAAYAAQGGHIIATGSIPTLAPGLEHQADSAAVAGLMKKVFAAPAAAQVASSIEFVTALHKALPPDLTSSNLPDPSASGNDLNAGLGFIHRVVPGPQKTDLYFVVNSSSSPLTTTLSFRAQHKVLTALSLDTGMAIEQDSGSAPLNVTFSPYESRVFLLSDEQHTRPEQKRPVQTMAASSPMSLTDWKLTFSGASPIALTSFVPWNSLPHRQFYSGEATYAASLHIDHPVAGGQRIMLDFGKGAAITDTRRPGSSGIHALLDPPIRDAAIVFIDGERAGSMWHPPYQFDVTRFLHAGTNKIEIRLYNTAVNELAGQPPRDYTALNAKYGKRFDPQDMNLIHSLPSGLLQAPTLRLEPAASAGTDAP
jgi:hypothetical protein